MRDVEVDGVRLMETTGWGAPTAAESRVAARPVLSLSEWPGR